MSFRLAPFIHLGLLHWRVVSTLSKIHAYDWINHLSVIFIDVLLQPLSSKPTRDAEKSILWCYFKERIFAILNNTDERAVSMLTLASSMRAGIVVWIKIVVSDAGHGHYREISPFRAKQDTSATRWCPVRPVTGVMTGVLYVIPYIFLYLMKVFSFPTRVLYFVYA